MWGADNYSEGFFAAIALMLMAIVVVVVIARSLFIIYSQPDGRRERATAVARSTGRRIALFTAFILAAHYLLNAKLRANAHDCQTQVSDQGGKYIAQLCTLRDGIYVGRVYDAMTHTLLVERTFASPEPQLSWTGEQISFQFGGDDASEVTLPPSLYDKLLAKIP